jgi:hypothetical protein
MEIDHQFDAILTEVLSPWAKWQGHDATLTTHLL